MAREGFGIEKLLRIEAENNDSVNVEILFGSAAPGADGGEQDDAPLGSLYIRQNGALSTLYQKQTDTNLAADWIENGSSSITVGVWRPEKVSVLTDDIQGAGVRDIVASPFSDDDAPVLTISDFVVGEFIISDADGTPTLLEITNVASPNVTFAVASTALSQDDTFLIRNYLPDAPGSQEGQAIANYNGSVMVKIGDVDWDFATGINISGSYTPASGNPDSNDSVESALEKIDGNVDQLTAAVGVAQGDGDMGTYTGALLNDNESAKQNIQQLESEAEASRTTMGTAAGDTDMGTYTGNLLNDNESAKQNIQQLETAVEALQDEVGEVGPANIPQSTPTTVDTVLVDECQYAEWEVVAHDIGDPTSVKRAKVSGFHNGHAGADATSVSDSVFDTKRIGSNFNLQLSVVLAGAAGAQTMGLQIETSDSDGIRYTARRTCVLAL